MRRYKGGGRGRIVVVIVAGGCLVMRNRSLAPEMTAAKKTVINSMKVDRSESEDVDGRAIGGRKRRSQLDLRGG